MEFCTISPAYHHEALARSESSVIEHNRRSEKKYINSVISTIFSWDPCKVTLYSNITKRLTNKKQRKECPIQGRSLTPHSFPILTMDTKTKTKTKMMKTKHTRYLPRYLPLVYIGLDTERARTSRWYWLCKISQLNYNFIFWSRLLVSPMHMIRTFDAGRHWSTHISLSLALSHALNSSVSVESSKPELVVSLQNSSCRLTFIYPSSTTHLSLFLSLSLDSSVAPCFSRV